MAPESKMRLIGILLFLGVRWKHFVPKGQPRSVAPGELRASFPA